MPKNRSILAVSLIQFGVKPRPAIPLVLPLNPKPAARDLVAAVLTARHVTSNKQWYRLVLRKDRAEFRAQLEISKTDIS